MTACGSSGTPKQTLTGNTNLTLMLTGTANDQLSEFDMQFQGITLTSQSGKTVTLQPSTGTGLSAEFMHINGNAEPLLTANVPQDVYTAATITPGAGEFVCIDLYTTGSGGQGTLDTHIFEDLGVAPSSTTVTLPAPITVTGKSMALSLALNVSLSATYSSCYDPSGTYTFSITPVFTLAPLTVSASPTNSANGTVFDLDGEITAIGSSGQSLTLSIPAFSATRTITASSNSNTAYQGVSGFSALTQGMFVDMDGALQADGSVLASRIAIEDPTAPEVFRGPLMMVTPSVSVVAQLPRMSQGSGINGFPVGAEFIDFSNAAFQISGAMTNLASLPFVPSFNASNMVPGQEVYFSAPSTSSGTYPPATTMTLMPQIVNGTVMGSTPAGNFTDYTISLASYDLFPMLAVQPGQTTVENNPNEIEVYVDSNTQMLNTAALATGSVLRFDGMVFNDNGTLRMDCAQVSDGVVLSSQSGPSSQKGIVESRITRRQGSRSLEQNIISIKNSR